MYTWGLLTPQAPTELIKYYLTQWNSCYGRRGSNNDNNCPISRWSIVSFLHTISVRVLPIRRRCFDISFTEKLLNYTVLNTQTNNPWTFWVFVRIYDEFRNRANHMRLQTCAETLLFCSNIRSSVQTRRVLRMVTG